MKQAVFFGSLPFAASGHSYVVICDNACQEKPPRAPRPILSCAWGARETSFLPLPDGLRLCPSRRPDLFWINFHFGEGARLQRRGWWLQGVVAVLQIVDLEDAVDGVDDPILADSCPGVVVHFLGAL